MNQCGFSSPSKNDLGRGLSCARTPGKAARSGLELRIDRRGGACSEACSSPSRPDATCRLIVKGLCEQSRSTQGVAAFEEPKERCTGGEHGSLPYGDW